MGKFGEILRETREKKRISFKKASKDLHLKIEHIKALEDEDWHNLPSATFIKGFISSYASYLGLDREKILALFRREYDETKFDQSPAREQSKRRFYITPTRLINLTFWLGILAFIIYLLVQYSSILSAPKIEISSPKDNEIVSVPVVNVEGIVEEDATVSIDGELVSTASGKFSYQYMLDEGKNEIEIIASKRLSPKTKITRTVRLIK